MNVKYWYEFQGLDEVLNRVEILCEQNVSPKEITGADEPFILQYSNIKRLEPVWGSQATFRIISEAIFQFTDLHTDDMQEFLVKFYRDGVLYWIGWLDAELYHENLSDFPPYPVEFSAADFNILERLKYRDEEEKTYTNIASLLTHLKRCFDRLALPFDKLYIGCSTTANGISVSAGETALHVLYMMSANFYDEDNEPMTCREVVENILRPFGLMMVQKDANVYIYDYNTVKLGLPMKRYDFETLNYEQDETINFHLGNLPDIGFMSADSSYGFEEMINNVKITSSLYGKVHLAESDVNEGSVSEKSGGTDGRAFKVAYYDKCENIENISGKFVRYTRVTDTIEGCYLPYVTNPVELTPVFRIKVPEYLFATEEWVSVNVKLQVYANTRDNPFNSEIGIKNDPNSGTIKLYCNLYTVDEKGVPLYFCNLDTREVSGVDPGQYERSPKYWDEAVNGRIEPGKFVLWFSQEDVTTSILDNWITNANVPNPHSNTVTSGLSTRISSYMIGKGIGIPTKSVSGYLIFEITNKCRIVNPTKDKGAGSDYLLAENKVKNLLLNGFSVNLQDSKGESLSTDDYEFKSYVNKKVATDFEEITLKCISANEEQAPVGKANILAKTGNTYKLQLSFTRSGATEILERLLMRTIHSNVSSKNKKITTTLEMTSNPALSYCTYKNVIQSDGMLITGATLDFRNAITVINAVEYSADVANLSSLPYYD